jgi:RNA polymerase sigma-70 factor (ECF subfamily)
LKGTWDLDRDPLAALRDGDTRLFEEFVRTEAGTLVGFFRRLGAGASEAEDLTQEVFLKLFQSARTYQPQRAFGAYALRVARNAWIDHRRRRAVRPAPAPAQGEDEGDAQDLFARTASAEASPESLAERRDELLLLAAAVRQLPERQLAAFELAVIQGLPYAEIGELLDVPVGTVKSRVFNAVRRVRAALERSEEPR